MDGQLMLALGLNTRPFEEGITRANNMVTRLGSTITSALGIYGAIGAFREIINYTKNATNDYIKLEQVISRTNNLLKNEHAYSQQKLDILKKQREEYEKIGVSQLQTAEAQYQILSRTPSGNDTYRELLLKASINRGANLGAAGGTSDVVGDIKSVQKDVGMAEQKLKHGKTGAELSSRITNALNLTYDELTALNDEYIKIHKQGLSNIKEQNAINLATIKTYASHYEGQYAATRAANPFTAITDALTKLRKELGKFGVEIATRALPTIKSAITWLKDLFEANKDKIKDAIIQLGKDVKAFVVGVKETSGFFKDLFSPLIALSKAVFNTTGAFEALGAAFVTYKVVSTISSLFEGFNKLKDFLGGSLKATAVMNVNATTVNVNGGLPSSSAPDAARGLLGGALTVVGGAMLVALTIGTIGALINGIKGAHTEGDSWYWQNLNPFAGSNGFQNDWESKVYSSRMHYEESGNNFDVGKEELKKRLKDLGYTGVTDALIEKLYNSYTAAGDEATPFERFETRYQNGNKPTMADVNKNILLLHQDYLNTQKAAASNPNPGQQNPQSNQQVGQDGISNTTVKGESPRQIIINIKDIIGIQGGNFSDLKESASKIADTITMAILQGIQAGEMLAPSK